MDETPTSYTMGPNERIDCHPDPEAERCLLTYSAQHFLESGKSNVFLTLRLWTLLLLLLSYIYYIYFRLSWTYYFQVILITYFLFDPEAEGVFLIFVYTVNDA